MKCFVCGKTINQNNEHIKIPCFVERKEITGSSSTEKDVRICMDCYKSRQDK